MPASFPASLDVLTNPSPTTPLDDPSLAHSGQHTLLNQIVAALEAKVGIDNSAVTTSLDYLIRNAALPAGIIVMWSGSIATIPSGWLLCDGTNGTPDLRDKFIVGAKQDDSGIAKSNIEGSLKQTGGVTGHSHSAHAVLVHAGGAVGDHTGLTHGLTIADHPDLTHAALSHPAITITHADHSIASVSHSHAAVTLTHADHSIASANAALAAFTITHADHSVASFTGSHPATTITHADHSIVSHANITVPSHSHATTTVNIADHSIASHANITVPSHSHATTTCASVSGNTGVLTTPTAATRGTLINNDNVSGISFASIAGASIAAATYTHAAGSVSGVSFASIAGASIAAVTYTHADHSIASVTHTHAAITLTHADHSIAAKSATIAAITVTHADHSVASFSGTGAATTLTHADHSFPSLSHQAIGTHIGTDYGVHTVTAPAAHGTAGTLTHSFTQPDSHTISAHDTVLSLPTYYALAYIMKA